MKRRDLTENVPNCVMGFEASNKQFVVLASETIVMKRKPEAVG
jgi:hypothetical protein